MSFLAPLYALGILAIAGPIILHLIRRQPNENLPFSSLLFLNPTPPRLTKRSRINDWLLLILRAMVILAMALAFARPYLRDSEKKTVTEPGRRVVIMVDTSASMNRQDLWQGALSAIEETLQQLQPQDEVALLSFDETPTLHVDFNHESRLQAAQQQQLILNAAKSLQPTARRTELGDALQFAAEFSVNGSEPSETDDTDMTIGDIATGNDTNPSSTSEQGSMQIVLISDMQTGGNLRSLQSYPWPKSVSVNLKSLQSSSASNATVSIMPSSDEDQRKEQRRLRVENANTSAKADFRLSWVANEKILPGSQNIQVPAGQTRVISMPQPSQDCTGVRLEGDDERFDNEFFFVQHEKTKHQILFWGPTAEDRRRDLFYYLERLPLSSQTREISFKLADKKMLSRADPQLHPLIVLAQPINESAFNPLRDYVDQGGTILCVLDDPAISGVMIDLVNRLTNSAWTSEPESTTDYVMLSNLAYDHPLFANLSDPKFNDFSKIKIWNHRSLLPTSTITSDTTTKIVASLDNSSPAIIQNPRGQGQVIAMTFGWQPSQSQLALSSKFLPLIDAMLTFQDTGNVASSVFIGESPLLPFSKTATLTLPNGETTTYQTKQDLESIDTPGVYEYSNDGVTKKFAVNLSRQESQTTPHAIEDFESLEIHLASLSAKSGLVERQRQIKDRELEQRQSIWQWALLAALILISVETLLSAKPRTVTTLDTQTT